VVGFSMRYRIIFMRPLKHPRSRVEAGGNAIQGIPGQSCKFRRAGDDLDGLSHHVSGYRPPPGRDGTLPPDNQRLAASEAIRPQRPVRNYRLLARRSEPMAQASIGPEDTRAADAR
jgi:hypothetical protein